MHRHVDTHALVHAPLCPPPPLHRLLTLARGWASVVVASPRPRIDYDYTVLGVPPAGGTVLVGPSTQIQALAWSVVYALVDVSAALAPLRAFQVRATWSDGAPAVVLAAGTVGADGPPTLPMASPTATAWTSVPLSGSAAALVISPRDGAYKRGQVWIAATVAGGTIAGRAAVATAFNLTVAIVASDTSGSSEPLWPKLLPAFVASVIITGVYWNLSMRRERARLEREESASEGTPSSAGTDLGGPRRPTPHLLRLRIHPPTPEHPAGRPSELVDLSDPKTVFEVRGSARGRPQRIHASFLGGGGLTVCGVAARGGAARQTEVTRFTALGSVRQTWHVPVLLPGTRPHDEANSDGAMPGTVQLATLHLMPAAPSRAPASCVLR